VRNLIQFLHHLNWEVWIVSASNQYTIRALSHHFGIPPERAIGIGLEKNGWRRLSSQLSLPVSAGNGKVDVLKQYGLSPDLVVGDSMGDHAMLMYSTYRGARIVVIGERIPLHHRHSNWFIQPEHTLNLVSA
ncbi:MAG: haloacid dehalogenase-like hydrolase, partial [Patescibacteria group bacterium]